MNSEAKRPDPGDLAMVVDGTPPEHIGSVVHCIGYLSPGLYRNSNNDSIMAADPMEYMEIEMRDGPAVTEHVLVARRDCMIKIEPDEESKEEEERAALSKA